MGNPALFIQGAGGIEMVADEHLYGPPLTVGMRIQVVVLNISGAGNRNPQSRQFFLTRVF